MADKNESVLWLPIGDRIFLGAVAPAVGGLAGFLLPRLAAWASTVPWIPFQGLFELVDSWSGWWVSYVFAGIGILLGAAFVAFAFHESVRMVVSEGGLRLTENGETEEIGRSRAATIFVDGKELVVLDSGSRQVVRAPIEEKPDVVERAFTAHGYSFVSGDPYGELYHRWVPDTPLLPAEVNAVMRARAKSLEKKSAVDARDLRSELDRIGIVVRDVKATQYWRPLVRR